MKRSKYIVRPLQWLTVVALFVFQACSDDLPGPMDTSDKFTVLKSIKIVNAGENGDIVLEGTINEDTKQITFPRIVPETDFSRLKFEITASDGAILEKDTYAVAFAEGDSEKTIALKLVNAPRFREYSATLRLKVPVFGADFSQPTVYDYSANPAGNPAHDAFTGQLTRGTGFDGEHVLVVSRASFSVANPHLLKVEDLVNNQVNRINLNVGTVVAGGTLVVHGGAQINGHTYVSNLSGAAASPLKIYHWTDPTALPEVIWNQTFSGFSGVGVRHGDNASYNIDNNGNGYIYFISQQGPIFRLKVSNYTTITEPTVLNAATVYQQWASMLQIGQTDSYLLTGSLHPISVTDASAAVSYTMGASSIPKQGSDARVVEFNGERYLIMVTVARYAGESTTLYVYDITRGTTITEALTNFEQTDRKELYQYTLSSIPNSAPASQTGFTILKDGEGNDETLRLFVAATDAGFVIIDLPKKVAED